MKWQIKLGRTLFVTASVGATVPSSIAELLWG